jgi:cobalt-zinc-cadmium efflux system outer membrane protein
MSRQAALGDISPLDEKKASIELALAKTALSRSQRELDMARIELSSSWGSLQPTFHQVEYAGNIATRLPAEKQLWEMLQKHPRIEMSRRAVEKLQASLLLAKSESWPDLELEGGVTYFNESNDYAYFMGISIPIPLFNRNQGGVDEASANFLRGKKEHESAALAMRRELVSLLGSLEVTRSELQAAQQDILPAARETYEALITAYKAGEKEYLELLDAQRTLIDVRHGKLLLETEYHELLADLEALVGVDISLLPGQDI